MTSPAENSPRIVLFGRDGKQLREFKSEIPPGTDNYLRQLIQETRCLQKQTNDFLTELMCQEKALKAIEENKEGKNKDRKDDDANYSGSKSKKKRKISAK